jgi:3-hydroxybutyryl-CoA dehydrogenase
MSLDFFTLSVVGTGAMGRGIAQIAAQAGSKVLLFDTLPEAVEKAISAISGVWDKQLDKGKIAPSAAAALYSIG